MEIPVFFLFFVLLLLHYFMASLTLTVKTSITTDQLALLALKGHITDDPYKTLASNWSTSTSDCSWIGISCGAKHLWVTTLNLSNMGLTETIAPQAGNLSFLPHLSFRNNNFKALCPTSWLIWASWKLFALDWTPFLDCYHHGLSPYLKSLTICSTIMS